MVESDIEAKRHDKVVELLMDLKERTSKIEEHLKSLNGKVIAQEKKLQEHEIEISEIKKLMYKGIGGLTVAFLAVQLVLM